MPDTVHDTKVPAVLQAEVLLSEWETDVLPRLPKGWEEEAKRQKAFERARHLRHPGDVLRGILAYVLCVRSFRHLGCWSVLIGLADVSEADWRKRLAQARAWLAWLLQEQLAVASCTTPWLLRKGARRVLLVDGTHLRGLGKKGKVWRVHTGFDLLAGRLAEVHLTDTHVAESWKLFDVQAGDVLVSDSINGYPEWIGWITDQQADAVVRCSAQTSPLFDEQASRSTWFPGSRGGTPRRVGWFTARSGCTWRMDASSRCA